MVVDSAYYEKLATEQYGIGFLLGNDELKNQVEATLLEMADDGKFMEIAEKYGLTELMELEMVPSRELMVRLTVASKDTTSAPVPAGAVSMEHSTFDGTLGLTNSGVVCAHDAKFEVDEVFSFKYVPPAFFGWETNKKIADHLAAVEDYDRLLYDAFCALPATEEEDVMLITDKGTIIRLNVKEISVLGRATQGVTLMRTNDGKVVSIETVSPEIEDEEVEIAEIPSPAVAVVVVVKR